MIKSLETNSWIRKKILLLIVLVVIPMIVLEIWITNSLSSYGGKIQKLEETQSYLRFENELLENQISQKTSLQEVEDMSKNLGFEKVRNIQYLPADNLAFKH